MLLMDFKATAVSVLFSYILSLIFGLFNLARLDWITFGTQYYGVLSMDPIIPFSYRFWEYTEFLPSTFMMIWAVELQVLGLFVFIRTTMAISKGNYLKSKEQREKTQEYAVLTVFCFFISVLCNVIGLSIWTYEICNGSFSKEHFSGEHCSNFNWNFSYFAGWISTLFLLFCTIGSFFWRKFVLEKIISPA